MRVVKVAIVILVLSGVAGAASDFLTEGVDNARTGWVRDEKVFTTANVGGTKLLWKVKLESTPRAMHNLFAPLVAERVTTPEGARELAVVAGVSDDLFGIDVVSGRQIWHRRFDSTLTNPGGTNDTLCPGGQTAVPTMAQTSPGTYTIYAVSWDGRLRQVNLADGKDVAAAEKFIPGGGKPYALNLYKGVIYTATAQGCGGLTNAFYSFDLATRRASAFIPAGGGLWGRRGAAIDSDGNVFLGTGDAQFDPLTRRLGNGIVAVKLDEKKQLQLADYFGAPNANWLWRRDLDVNTTPVVIDYRNRKFLVGTSKECRLWLLDREGLGGEDHRTTLHTTPLICNDAQAFDGRGIWGALSAWQDDKGTQWVLAPFWGPVSTTFKAPIEHARPAGGGVAAFKLEERAGAWQLSPAWLSRDMDLGEEAVIANGIVFAYAAGEDATQVVADRAWDEPGGPVYGGGLSSGPARRVPNSRRAALYALDAQTGKELWSSGNQIESWNHFSGLTVANGRAYIATFDGTLYCFGIPR
ncbi:MAG TPA: PQQ-binding-like beta-propeller repeat protein [Vicinamibacterales bacterium]|nr:PQQ-binding-like beta-propeller repeat protein [Vicinamibacterales bacterium]